MTKKKDIEVLRVTHLRGPNIWTYRPVIEAWLDIGELEKFPSNLLPGLYERLTAILPGLIVHRCGVGEHGGFLERLRDGTYAGHILEHVVLELQNLAGMKTGFGKTRQIGDGTGLYKMAFRTRQEQVGRAALAAGRDLLMAMIEDKPYDLAATIIDLTDLVESVCLGPSTANIVDAATVRKIPSIRLTDGNLVQLGHGAMQRRIWTAETEETSAIAEGIASDKDLTKSLLSSCGVPVPEGELVTSAEAAWEAAQDIGVPVVVKPYDGNHGRGVSLNLMTEADVTAAYVLAARKGDSKSVIVERFIAGNEHRLLVVGKRLIAAAAGESLWVTGNGKSNIIELVDDQINTDPRRGTTEDSPLNALAPEHGAEIILELERQGMTAYSVPQDGQKVLIQPNGNVAFDVTDQVHPQVAAMATLAARVVGLDIAGIDVVASDISRPLHETGGAIIEVNASPGLLAHLKPASGEPRNVGEAIVDHLFAPEEGGRMPIVGITGKHGTTMASRLIAWLLQISGKKVGLACADGLFVNGRLLPRDGFSDWETGERLLLNKNVEAGVFEASARMILTEGLAYDKCAVGVVTDVSDFEDVAEFHIPSLDKLYGVLRTQVDVILPSGVAVLNAADAQVVDMAELCDGEVIFYGVDEHLAAIAEHRQDGKRVVFQRADRIVLAQGYDDVASLPLSPLVPPEAVLAAIAAGWALGLSPELIGAGLRTFDANPKRTHH
ncbi:MULTISPECIES: cyanophycin synthetase [unclassified Duganella]|uniref:cyanophycin synthetase n=1 Tax=unclassified Duganella TaxID=2636909 RepID=UPI000E35546B|nr:MULTISPECIES: cyanophycin synthetase [unclassified Duganella]RFP18274.1 cyanophycin synthetase [Duganella sp. BJB475]RFP34939.1 cyanophycin synthetase [Duganella sp. BJB476]